MNALVPSFRRAPIFSSLSQETRLEIERASDEKSFARRRIIFKADEKAEYVFLLVSGRVKLIRTSRTGRELTISLVNPNEIFGASNLFDTDVTYDVTAEALEESAVLVVDRRQLSSAVQESNAALLEYAILQDHCRAVAETRLAEHVFYDVPRRIAKLLGQLAVEHGRASKGGALIRIKLTHQDIANLVGSTRETTTLVLNDFRRRGVIDFSGRRIIICDIEDLAELS